MPKSWELVAPRSKDGNTITESLWGDALLRLYKKFGVNINWLLSGAGDPYVVSDQQSISLEEKVVTMEARVKALEKMITKLTKS